MYNLKKAGMRSKNSCKCSKKLLRALLLSTLFAVPSQFASAQLNIALSNAQLGTMIKQIQSQSQYQFFYDDDLADTPISSVNVKDASVEEVLNTALAGKGISYRVDENVVYLSKASTSPSASSTSLKAAQQQTKTVTGRIIDAKGEPLIGVTVIEKAQLTVLSLTLTVTTHCQYPMLQCCSILM